MKRSTRQNKTSEPIPAVMTLPEPENPPVATPERPKFDMVEYRGYIIEWSRTDNQDFVITKDGIDAASFAISKTLPFAYGLHKCRCEVDNLIQRGNA